MCCGTALTPLTIPLYTAYSNHSLLRIMSLDVELIPGEHSVMWTLAGYDPLYSLISVSELGAVSCLSVEGGACGRIVPPGVVASDALVTGYLKESGVYPDYAAWYAAKSADGVGLGDVYEITDGFLAIEDLGFTVILSNVYTVTDAFLGIG